MGLYGMVCAGNEPQDSKITENINFEKIVNGTVVDIEDGIDRIDEKGRRVINERKMGGVRRSYCCYV